MYRRRRKRNNTPVKWERDDEILTRVEKLVNELQIEWVDINGIHTFRSYNSSSNAIARIWGLSKIWQMAIDQGPTYIIEVISEKFDRLSEHQKNEVILHELAHIPRNFSGALMAHSHGKGAFHDKLKLFLNSYRKMK